mmetsp:Transcript_76/g.130  ORF Transcript_76/g.130 Transcript_76/m.130 type:complete len:268 (+) Transcript_76:141-944(+)
MSGTSNSDPIVLPSSGDEENPVSRGGNVARRIVLSSDSSSDESHPASSNKRKREPEVIDLTGSPTNHTPINKTKRFRVVSQSQSKRKTRQRTVRHNVSCQTDQISARHAVSPLAFRNPTPVSRNGWQEVACRKHRSWDMRTVINGRLRYKLDERGKFIKIAGVQKKTSLSRAAFDAAQNTTATVYYSHHERSAFQTLLTLYPPTESALKDVKFDNLSKEDREYWVRMESKISDYLHPKHRRPSQVHSHARKRLTRTRAEDYDYPNLR